MSSELLQVYLGTARAVTKTRLSHSCHISHMTFGDKAAGYLNVIAVIASSIVIPFLFQPQNTLNNTCLHLCRLYRLALQDVVEYEIPTFSSARFSRHCDVLASPAILRR